MPFGNQKQGRIFMKVCAILVVIGMILVISGAKSHDEGTTMLGFCLAIGGACAFFLCLGSKRKSTGDNGTTVNVTHNHYDSSGKKR